MDFSSRELRIVTYFGRQYKLTCQSGQSIKAFKDKIKSEMLGEGFEDAPEFSLIYCGKKLLNEDESLSVHLKDDNNTIYIMSSQVHGGCQPRDNSLLDD